MLSKRVLVDKIYRTKENIAYCEERGIQLSGRRAGRPTKDEELSRQQEKELKKNDIDRIEVEHFFSLGKRCYFAALITTKLTETILSRIALSVLVANLFGTGHSFFVFYFAVPSEELPPISLIEIID